MSRSALLVGLLGAAVALGAAGCRGVIGQGSEGVDAGPVAAIDAARGKTDAASEGPDAISNDGTAPVGDGAVVTDVGVSAGDDAGAPDASAGDTGSSSATIPIFVAQGMVGRTTISCDDGRTWVADRAWDTEGDAHLCGSTDPVVCFEAGAQCSYVGYDGTCNQGECDCGYNPGFSKGVVFGDGAFVATWGWGHPGSVRRSRNGVDWEQTLDGDQFGGLAYGAGHFVLASRSPQVSADGSSWSAGAEADFRQADGQVVWSVRRFAFANYEAGRFVAVASGNAERDVLISSDAGRSWWRPSVLPVDCATEVSTYGGIVDGDGVILIVDQSARACRSTDGGDTWSVTPIANIEIYSHGVWTGREFWFWGNDNRRYSSPDGVAWTATPMRTPHRIGPVTRGANGTLVAVANVWEGYAAQSFLRSEDGGLTWEVLAAGTFAPSHPIFHLAFGQATPSTVCPGP